MGILFFSDLDESQGVEISVNPYKCYVCRRNDNFQEFLTSYIVRYHSNDLIHFLIHHDYLESAKERCVLSNASKKSVTHIAKLLRDNDQSLSVAFPTQQGFITNLECMTFNKEKSNMNDILREYCDDDNAIDFIQAIAIEDGKPKILPYNAVKEGFKKIIPKTEVLEIVRQFDEKIKVINSLKNLGEVTEVMVGYKTKDDGDNLILDIRFLNGVKDFPDGEAYLICCCSDPAALAIFNWAINALEEHLRK